LQGEEAVDGERIFLHHPLEILLGEIPAIAIVGLLQDGIDPRRIEVCHKGAQRLRRKDLVVDHCPICFGPRAVCRDVTVKQEQAGEHITFRTAGGEHGENVSFT